MPAIRTTVAVLSCTALLGGLASPAFAQDTAGTYPSDTTNSSQTHKHKKGKKRHGVARGERRGHGEHRGGGCKKPSGSTGDTGGSYPTDAAGSYPTAA